MQAQAARTSRVSLGAVFVLVSVGLWTFTCAWMRVPDYLFHAEGQLYALFPLALLTEAVVIVLSVIGAVVAIVDVARRRIRALKAALIFAGVAFMLTLGPIFLWFGTIPIGAHLFG
ncbi:hypothetical protein GCM10009840_10190 [Pseudolysinimonas kribbensis]|uniref:Uncharacterized protein n=1 Tax=Pseudolysinimonas kribbensis TaxID=433641 RepID=A0ABQ6K644_9MICO|nr:hypothetical protein [Pseudolysinimonas kribbensis]GMA95437.1 hypothetical protein GCM10025881_22610 [Pseudolysinimonas kribbensis]